MAKLKQWFDSSPKLDLGSGFFMVAVKSSSSEIPHIGYNNFEEFMTFLIPLGDWTGIAFFAYPK
jgi:hypothetical protein